MLYLIGGASRAGKTQVADRLMKELGAPRFSLDYLITAFDQGNPSLGVVHDLTARMVGERLWTYLKPMLINILEEEPLYIVEGDALLPRHAHELFDRYPEMIRACFLGYPDIEVDAKVQAIKSFTGGANNWTRTASDREIQGLVLEGIRYSSELEAECAALKLPFFNTGPDFDSTIERAIQTLTQIHGLYLENQRPNN
jgi:hypothetical protein